MLNIQCCEILWVNWKKLSHTVHFFTKHDIPVEFYCGGLFQDTQEVKEVRPECVIEL